MNAKALLGLLGLVFIAVFLPVLWALALIWWNNPDYSHGLLIPLISGYLVWSQKDELKRAPVRPNGWGGPLVVASIILLMLGKGATLLGGGYGTGGLFFMWLAFIGAVGGLVLLLLGLEFSKLLALPLLYLVFMVPLPGRVFEMVTLPLQTYATGVTTAALQLFGIPALREGNLITLPTMTLGVVEACSGIRSLFTLLALAAAIALSLMTKMPVWQRVLLFLSAVPVAIVTNAFRVTATGLMAHTWGREAAQGFYHDFSGWVIFVSATFLLTAEIFLLTQIAKE